VAEARTMKGGNAAMRQQAKTGAQRVGGTTARNPPAGARSGLTA
jgi:hypothetical protein